MAFHNISSGDLDMHNYQNTWQIDIIDDEGNSDLIWQNGNDGSSSLSLDSNGFYMWYIWILMWLLNIQNQILL